MRMQLPSTKDLEALKAKDRRRNTVTMKDHLRDNFGIVTMDDLFKFLNKNIIKGKQECNYDIMVRTMGETVADKLMRQLEIREWF